MLQFLSGKWGIIFGIAWIAFGLVFFFGYNWLQTTYESPTSVRSSFILSFFLHTLGRYGSAGLFTGVGILSVFRGWMGMKQGK